VSKGASKTWQVDHKLTGATEMSDSPRKYTWTIQNVSDYNHNNYTDILILVKMDMGMFSSTATYMIPDDMGWSYSALINIDPSNPQLLVPIKYYKPAHGLDWEASISKINTLQDGIWPQKNWSATTSGNILTISYSRDDNRLKETSDLYRNYTQTITIKWDMTTGLLISYEMKNVYTFDNLQELWTITILEAGIPAFGFIGVLMGVALIGSIIIFLKKPALKYKKN